jgi:hypothetical protein
MILGNTERGRRWRRNEDVSSLLGDKLATSRYDIWRKHTEWALAILENEAVEINEVPNAAGDFICYARELSKPAEILSDCGECKLELGAARPTQSQTTKPQDALEMGK